MNKLISELLLSNSQPITGGNISFLKSEARKCQSDINNIKVKII